MEKMKRKRRKRYRVKNKGNLLFLVLTPILLLVIVITGVKIHIIKNDDPIEPSIIALREEASEIEIPEERKDAKWLKTSGWSIPCVLDTFIEYEKYPEDLNTFLAANPDQYWFVEDYKSRFLKDFSEDPTTEFKPGHFPLYIQWDERWAYSPLGDGCTAINGCGPTSLSMVYQGLTGDNTKTPYHFSQFAEEEGYYVNEVGCSWSIMTEGAKAWGLKSEDIWLDKETVVNTLKSGTPIICSMKKGDFTSGGHFIVLTDATEDGKIKVNDPSSPFRSLILWDYDRIEPQISALWAVSF